MDSGKVWGNSHGSGSYSHPLEQELILWPQTPHPPSANSLFMNLGGLVDVRQSKSESEDQACVWYCTPLPVFS